MTYILLVSLIIHTSTPTSTTPHTLPITIPAISPPLKPPEEPTTDVSVVHAGERTSMKASNPPLPLQCRDSLHPDKGLKDAALSTACVYGMHVCLCVYICVCAYVYVYIQMGLDILQ